MESERSATHDNAPRETAVAGRAQGKRAGQFLREIARATHTQPGTVRRELSLLTQAGVIERDVLGNQVRFRANESYPIYEELRNIL